MAENVILTGATFGDGNGLPQWATEATLSNLLKEIQKLQKLTDTQMKRAAKEAKRHRLVEDTTASVQHSRSKSGTEHAHRKHRGDAVPGIRDPAL